MTKTDIARLSSMAFDAGITCSGDMVAALERFEALAVAAEREACAKVCDDFEHGNWEYMEGSRLCAAAIRARGTP